MTRWQQIRLFLACLLLAAACVAPSAWLAYMQGQQEQRQAAEDRAAWCAHDWRELAAVECGEFEVLPDGSVRAAR